MLYQLLVLILLLATPFAYLVETNGTKIESICQRFPRCKDLGDGWVTLFDGYQYKKLPGAHTWDESRTICGSMEGDLVVHGIQDMGSRRLLFEALMIRNTQTWIGLKFKASDSSWYWVNGERGVPSAIMWADKEPYNPSEHWCAQIASDLYMGMGTNDQSCDYETNAICEKEL